jgi:hypothetical protein
MRHRPVVSYILRIQGAGREMKYFHGAPNTFQAGRPTFLMMGHAAQSAASAAVAIDQTQSQYPGAKSVISSAKPLSEAMTRLVTSRDRAIASAPMLH